MEKMMDSASKAEMLSKYKPLIRAEVARYIRKLGDLASGMEEDLEQAASVGFLTALSSFDPGKSPAIVPYLRRGVDMAIMSELTDNLRLIRQPRYVQGFARKLRRAALDDPDADDESLCRQTGLDPNELALARKAISAEDICHIDAFPDLGDSIPSESMFEDGVAEDIMVDQLRRAIDNLDSDDSFIIRSYSGAFGTEKLSLDQLARHFSYSLFLISARIRHIMYALSFDLNG